MEGSFGRLKGSDRLRKAMPMMRSPEQIAKISSIFLTNPPLRKLSPIIVNLGFFFDRMIEYSIALNDSSKSNEVLLDIGPYYSCFPSYLASHSYSIALDINRDAMNFQKKVSIAMGKNISEGLECIVADATRLPFRNDVIDKIFVISTLEHIEKDNLAAEEFGRVLRRNGICTITGLPFSKLAREPQIKPFFIRRYTKDLIQTRIITPSLLSLERFFTFSKTLLSLFYATVPEGWFVFKDLMIGLTLFKMEEFFLSEDKEGSYAIVKLRKDF